MEDPYPCLADFCWLIHESTRAQEQFSSLWKQPRTWKASIPAKEFWLVEWKQKKKTNHTRLKITERAWCYRRKPSFRWTLTGCWRESLGPFSKGRLSTALTIWARKGPKKQNTRPSKCRHKTVKGEWGDQSVRSASCWVAKWQGCELQAK